LQLQGTLAQTIAENIDSNSHERNIDIKFTMNLLNFNFLFATLFFLFGTFFNHRLKTAEGRMLKKLP
jgi:hypothetical protein